MIALLEERARIIDHWKEFYENIGEPDIRDSKTEAFRFQYTIVYDNYFVLTVVAVDTADSTQLLQGMPAKANLSCKLVLQGDSLARSSSQVISEKEFEEFKKLLNGTYYWKLGEGCGDGVVDDGVLYCGNTMVFESRSYTCGRDTLTFKSTNLDPLYDGSFKSAFSYLAKKSPIFKKDKGLQKWILEHGE